MVGFGVKRLEHLWGAVIHKARSPSDVILDSCSHGMLLVQSKCLIGTNCCLMFLKSNLSRRRWEVLFLVRPQINQSGWLQQSPPLSVCRWETDSGQAEEDVGGGAASLQGAASGRKHKEVVRPGQPARTLWLSAGRENWCWRGLFSSAEVGHSLKLSASTYWKHTHKLYNSLFSAWRDFFGWGGYCGKTCAAFTLLTL